MFSKQWFTKLPWGMICLVFCIASMGLTAVYSATYTSRGPSTLFYKQMIWISIGIVIMFLALIPDYHTIGRYAYILYACSLVLLVLVMAIGRTGMGAQRWLAIGPFVFQPSEFAKLSLTLALARFFAEDPKRGGYELKDLAVPGVMVLVPLLLVLKQPDLGTAIMLLLTSLLIAMLAGIQMRSLIVVLLAVALVVSAVFFVRPSGIRYGVRSSRISRTGSRRSSIPAPILWAAAITPSRPRLRWARARSPARDTARGRRARWPFCRSAIRISSLPLSPRRRASSAPASLFSSTSSCSWSASTPRRTQKTGSAFSWPGASCP